MKIHAAPFPIALSISLMLGGVAAAAPHASEETNPRVIPQYKQAAPDQFRAPGPAVRTPFSLLPVANGLEWPWAIEELPDGAMLVTQRTGAMRIVSPGGVVSDPITGVPPVNPQVKGGLLDVALSPDFATSHRIFWCYAEPVGADSRLAVASGTLSADRKSLGDVKVIWRMERAMPSHEHFGARLAFDKQGMLMFATGERSPDGGAFGRDSVLAARDFAQDWSSTLGKVIRIAPDGSVPGDNPAPHGPGARPDVFAAGFRNPLADAIDPATGDLWTVEHGPKSGDELNHILPGKNYGWPVVSYGIEYHGDPVGKGITAAKGMEQPVYFWDPNIAPGAMLFYTGTAFPGWAGNIIIAGMKSHRLSRMVMKHGRVAVEEWLPTGVRIRDVIQAHDGSLLLLTDEAMGRILRLVPRR